MAEFVVVTKQAERMCASQYCMECPLSSDNNFAKEHCETFRVNHPDVYETVVMQWAAAHPEPRYPTWTEWYKKAYPDAHKYFQPCPNAFYKVCDMREYHGELECYECKNSPIPADIAKKLGIKPIEVDGDD